MLSTALASLQFYSMCANTSAYTSHDCLPHNRTTRKSFPVSKLPPFTDVAEGPCFQALGISQLFLAEWPEGPSENFQDYRLG